MSKKTLNQTNLEKLGAQKHNMGTTHSLNLPDEMPLMWILRDPLNITGVK